MSKLSPITGLKEADLQIPEGPLTGAALREAFRRLFAELNPYFDAINKLAAKGITFADNIAADVATGQFSHGVAQRVALKTLKRADFAWVQKAESQVPFYASVAMIQSTSPKDVPACNVTVTFQDTAAVNVVCTILLLSR
jgi:hypothetical protein